MRWLRGVTVHGAVLWLCLMGLTVASAYGSWAIAVLVGAVVARLLLALRASLARTVSGFAVGTSSNAGGREAVWETHDPGFTGGWTGVYAPGVSVRPARWEAELTAAGLGVALRRRELAVLTGGLRRGRLVALGFTLVGLMLSLWLAQRMTTPGTVANTLTASLWFTLWSFGGLLVLPTVSRRGVAAVDAAYLCEPDADPALLAEVARRLDALQDGEPTRPGLVETIFHPLPSVDNRKAGRTPTRFGAWDANRLTVYLGLCGGSLLTRAVHCNAGRPALWVWLPTD